MIEVARRRGSADGHINGSVDFILAGCAKPTTYAGEHFDVIFGA